MDKSREIRAFLSIKLPDVAGNAVTKFKRHHLGLPVRWVPRENLHITVFFLGTVLQEKIPELIGILTSLLQEPRRDAITFSHIDWAPPLSQTRMIWLYGQSEPRWDVFKKQLRNRLTQHKLYHGTDERPFRTHVTVARIAAQAPRKNLPGIQTPFSLEFTPNEILLMESKLSPKGATYETLERLSL